MRALLLAAGLGTRLNPITNYIPKCLVPINGKPLLQYWIETLIECGITEILINTHYKYEMVESFIQTSKYKDKITLIYEEKLLNTGGTILKNKYFFNEDNFMVIHADNLCFADFKGFIKTHLKSNINIVMTMMTFKTSTPSSCGIVKIDKNNIVLDFFEKVKNPPSNLANAAVYIFRKEIFTYLEEFNKENIDLSIEVIPKLKGKILTYFNNKYLRDIGNIESYALSQIEVLKYI